MISFNEHKPFYFIFYNVVEQMRGDAFVWLNAASKHKDAASK